MRTRIGISVVALGVALALILSACVSAAPKSAPGIEPVPSSLSKFYDQTLTWHSCESGGLTCTTVTTPIDWAHPSAGSLKLAVIRHATTSSTRIGSLLVNPGGPGGSGYDFVAQSLDYAADATLRKDFDIVGWDPRGVGKSSPITCLEGPAMDTFLYAVSPYPEGSDAWLQSRVPIEKAYAAACAKNSGPLLGHIDAESNARDMDLMRALLGDTKLNYLGFSYGTFFGAHYAKLFPKNVGRMVLDGPVDPSITEPVDFTTQMGGFESAFRAYLTDCLTGSSCPFSGTLDDALAQARALIAQVGTEGLTIKDGRTLDLSSLGTAISYPLYSRDSWPDLSTMFAQLQKGDADAAFQFADGYNGRNDDGTYSEENNVYTAALCLDGVFPDSLAGTRATMDTIAQAAPTIGAIFSYSDWVQVSIACQNWPYKSVLHPEKIAAKGAAPIMVVGTTNDPATPYTGAQSLASQLDSGFLVTRTGEGHTAYGSGNACIDSTVDTYLVKGTVPAKDPQC
ncbi:MAG: peptidase [Microbacteriaceae bacterium]|nr:peptidase [Microbacteriaceae bacterium]